MSKKVKEAGHQAVIEYEAKNGRAAEIHEKNGYDIRSQGKDETRHIEVKSTDKARFTWRHFTDAEFRAAMSDPDFYLYLVTNASIDPHITEFRRDDLLKRYRGTTVLHVISFPKAIKQQKKV